MQSISRVTCQRKVYSIQQLDHIHDYAQLSIPVTGGKMNTINGLSVEHKPNCALFIPPNARHSAYANRPNEFLMFNIPVTSAFSRHSSIGCIIRINEKAEAAKHVIELEVGEGVNDSAIVTDICMYLMDQFCRDASPRSVKYIHDHYMQKITVKELAEMENYNHTYYCDWFAHKYACTPLGYITALRMEKAKELLADKRFTVLQTALHVGYESESSFSKRFCAYTGVSPGQYKKN